MQDGFPHVHLSIPKPREVANEARCHRLTGTRITENPGNALNCRLGTCRRAVQRAVEFNVVSRKKGIREKWIHAEGVFCFHPERKKATRIVFAFLLLSVASWFHLMVNAIFCSSTMLRRLINA